MKIEKECNCKCTCDQTQEISDVLYQNKEKKSATQSYYLNTYEDYHKPKITPITKGFKLISYEQATYTKSINNGTTITQNTNIPEAYKATITIPMIEETKEVNPSTSKTYNQIIYEYALKNKKILTTKDKGYISAGYSS